MVAETMSTDESPELSAVMGLPIVYTDADRVTDGKEGDRHISRDKFDEVQEEVIDACGRHGTTAPWGDNYAKDSVYYIVDDMRNDWERFQSMVIRRPSGLTVPWLADMIAVVRKHAGWRISVGGFGGGHVVILADKILVTGDGFRHCTTVEQLLDTAVRGLRIQHLMRNCTDSALEELASIAAHLDKLNLRRSEVTDEGLVHLQGFPKLESLFLNSTSITDAGLSNLRHVPLLRDLRLNETSVTDAGLVHLKTLKQLRTLVLDDTRIRGTGFGNIGCLPHVEELWLQSTEVDDAALQELAKCRNLKTLYFADAPITDKGLMEIAKLLQLERLSLMHTKVTDEGLKRLQSLSQLRELTLDRTSITDAGLPHLVAIESLREIHLVGTGVTDRGVPTLLQFPTLDKLFVGDTRITDEGIAKLRERFPDAWIW